MSKNNKKKASEISVKRIEKTAPKKAIRSLDTRPIRPDQKAPTPLPKAVAKTSIKHAEKSAPKKAEVQIPDNVPKRAELHGQKPLVKQLHAQLSHLKPETYSLINESLLDTVYMTGKNKDQKHLLQNIQEIILTPSTSSASRDELVHLLHNLDHYTSKDQDKLSKKFFTTTLIKEGLAKLSPKSWAVLKTIKTPVSPKNIQENIHLFLRRINTLTHFDASHAVRKELMNFHDTILATVQQEKDFHFSAPQKTSHGDSKSLTEKRKAHHAEIKKLHPKQKDKRTTPGMSTQNMIDCDSSPQHVKGYTSKAFRAQRNRTPRKIGRVA